MLDDGIRCEGGQTCSSHAPSEKGVFAEAKVLGPSSGAEAQLGPRFRLETPDAVVRRPPVEHVARVVEAVVALDPDGAVEGPDGAVRAGDTLDDVGARFEGGDAA